MHRTTVVATLGFVITLFAGRAALAQAPPSPCAAVKDHAEDTVILFQPPSTFNVCRRGAVEDGVVTDRNVYLELVPTPGPRMFDFRVHGKTGDWTPMGLHAWESLTTGIAAKLRDLDHSGEPISELVIPVEPPPAASNPLRSLAAARTRYLAEVTPQYLDALHGVYAESRELPVIGDVVRRWCGALAAQVPGTLSAEAELRATCAAPELREGAVEQALKDFEAAVQKGSADRVHAREATLAAIAHPEDAAAVAEGIRSLDAARAGATSVVATAHALREASSALARAIATLRVSLRSLDALRPGEPTYLSTYSTGGNAELEIDASPTDIAAAGADTEHATTGKATGRFPIFGRHYLDIEAGLGWAAGAPDSLSSTVARDGAQVIQTQPVQEFVGLALVELEALRFLWPEKPLAGLLRLPVVGIPFTRDPTANFFVGAGLGWTGVGSISVGPYLVREAMLRQGVSAYQPLPSDVSFSALTYGGVGVGYFVSASVDLFGLFHLVVPNRSPTIDASTGKEK